MLAFHDEPTDHSVVKFADKRNVVEVGLILGLGN